MQGRIRGNRPFLDTQLYFGERGTFTPLIRKSGQDKTSACFLDTGLSEHLCCSMGLLMDKRVDYLGAVRLPTVGGRKEEFMVSKGVIRWPSPNKFLPLLEKHHRQVYILSPINEAPNKRNGVYPTLAIGMKLLRSMVLDFNDTEFCLTPRNYFYKLWCKIHWKLYSTYPWEPR